MRFATVVAAITFAAFAFVVVPAAHAQQSGYARCMANCKKDTKACQIACRNK
jgi:hypothetical protein